VQCGGILKCIRFGYKGANYGERIMMGRLSVVGSASQFSKNKSQHEACANRSNRAVAFMLMNTGELRFVLQGKHVKIMLVWFRDIRRKGWMCN
jgi:hypothetical protein